MDRIDVSSRLDDAINSLISNDVHLLRSNAHERSIAGRLGVYVEQNFLKYDVDIEYNRHGVEVKKVRLPAECANAVNDSGKSIVIPDLVVHRRGNDNGNLLVVEIKTTTNKTPRGCDEVRILSVMEQLGYTFGIFLDFEAGVEAAGLKTKKWIEPGASAA